MRSLPEYLGQSYRFMGDHSKELIAKGFINEYEDLCDAIEAIDLNEFTELTALLLEKVDGNVSNKLLQDLIVIAGFESQEEYYHTLEDLPKFPHISWVQEDRIHRVLVPHGWVEVGDFKKVEFGDAAFSFITWEWELVRSEDFGRLAIAVGHSIIRKP